MSSLLKSQLNTSLKRAATGTTLKFYMPVTKKGIIQEKRQLNKILKGEGTILLVDDEPIIRKVCKKVLEKLGYKVIIAIDGSEALELYAKDHGEIKLVILDMIMPFMGGGETFDKLKDINPRICVLLASGFSLNNEVEELLKKGCKGFLQKPFSLSQLSEKIRDILIND